MNIDNVKINTSLIMMKEWEIHSRRPKDFPRPERFPEGEARGKSRGSREIWRAEGMDFAIPPEFWWSTDNLSASILIQGVDQNILPCGQGRIDSVKINPSLLMMRDWIIQQPFLPPCYQFLVIEELKLNRQQCRCKIILWWGVTFQTLPTTPGWCKLFDFFQFVHTWKLRIVHTWANFDLSTRGEAVKEMWL